MSLTVALTKLCVMHRFGTWYEQAPHIAEILKHNRTLQHLELSEFDVGICGEGVGVLDIDALLHFTHCTGADPGK